MARGIRFENCTDSVEKAVVVIEANSTAEFNQTTFKDNMNSAVYIAKESNVTFTRSRFEGNQASIKGGAIYVDTKAHIEVYSSIFTGNLHALNDENAMLLMSKTLTEASLGNKALKGGAIYVEADSTLKIHESSLLSKFACYETHSHFLLGIGGLLINHALSRQ